MPLVVIALVTTGLLAACGGGGDDDGGVATLDEGGSEGENAQSDEEAQEEELLDWVQCMRDNGVDISDPTRDEDGNLVIEGPGIRIGTGGPEAGGGGGPSEESLDAPEDQEPIDPEAMEAANEECGRPPAVGGEMSEEDQQAMQDAAMEFAECMRDEGIEDFPDPDFSDDGMPAEGQAEAEAEDDGDGGPTVMVGPFGEIDMDDPEVAAAFEQCQDVLAAGRPGDGPDQADGPASQGSDG